VTGLRARTLPRFTAARGLGQAGPGLWRPRGAQNASITAAATVSQTALSVVAIANTRFGTVTPGTPVTINPQTSANAGEFEFHGNRNAQINATFTLPTQLTTGTGGYTMPITFGANTACRRNTAVQGGCTRFNPATGFTARLRNQNPPNDTYFVWMGGTVSPAAGQHPGVYRGTITVTAAYTGL